jgi:NADH:ubiquinone oxidoreductase subunit E
MSAETIRNSINDAKNQHANIIAILEDIQSKYGYLSEKSLRIVAEETGQSLVDIYGVATFYKTFSLNPRGEHHVSVCLGTACHVRGGPTIEKEFQRGLRCKTGETTPDKKFTLETVACLGACALGPIVVIDQHYFSKVNTHDIKRIIQKTLEGLDKVDVTKDKSVFPVELICARCAHSLMDPTYLIDGHPSVRVTIYFGRQHGWLRLSSVYGSYTIESEYEVPKNAVVTFFCPHCHTELKGSVPCSDCHAPMVSMGVRGGGVVQICSRRGCKGHMLEVTDTN